MIQKEMDDLHEKDIECNKKNQPSINKLQNIDSIAQKLKHVINNFLISYFKIICSLKIDF